LGIRRHAAAASPAGAGARLSGRPDRIERVQMLGSGSQSSVSVIQLALTPVFLLAAVAALLNVFSTRLGRVADRVDLLTSKLQGTAADTEFLSAQLDRLRRRSHYLDWAVVLATIGGTATCFAAAGLRGVVARQQQETADKGQPGPNT
jgi:hypothetical protein